LFAAFGIGVETVVRLYRNLRGRIANSELREFAGDLESDSAGLRVE
jgi:hypothetical protein